MSTMSQRSLSPTFYRRQLPSNLISFNSVNGRKMFKESLAEGSAEAFLSLSGNLAHQSEPAFCGLGSLAIVLNALELDPNRIWKGVWRWYDETLLDCCAPLETIRKNGLTFDEFACLARCNGLDVHPKRFQEAIPYSEFLSDLEKVCTDSTGSIHMIVSFSRESLGQTGDGHFSPIGAFHSTSNHVLVLDVARFKYPSYFVDARAIYNAMKPIDNVTGKSRGYFLLRKRAASQSTLTYPDHLCKIIPTSVTNISAILNSFPTCLENLSEFEVVDYLLDFLIGDLSSPNISLSFNQIVDLAGTTATLKHPHHSIQELIDQVKCLPVFKIVYDRLSKRGLVSDIETVKIVLILLAVPINMKCIREWKHINGCKNSDCTSGRARMRLKFEIQRLEELFENMIRSD